MFQLQIDWIKVFAQFVAFSGIVSCQVEGVGGENAAECKEEEVRRLVGRQLIDDSTGIDAGL